MVLPHQMMDILQRNEKAAEKLTKDVDEMKSMLHRLNLSSYVSTNPPTGRIDLTPCLKPQPPAQVEQPAQRQPPQTAHITESKRSHARILFTLWTVATNKNKQTKSLMPTFQTSIFSYPISGSRSWGYIIVL